MKRWILPPLITATGIAFSQMSLPVPDTEVKRTMPNDSKEMIDTEYKRLYEQSQQSAAEENERLKKELEAWKAQGNATNIPNTIPTVPGASESVPSPATMGNDLGNVSGNFQSPRKPRGDFFAAPTQKLSSGVQVFAVTADADTNLTVLPAGSWVRAKLLTGVQANARYPYNVLMQLDYAYTGPNGTKIPLQGCLIIGGAMADLSIERVIISPHTLSCVRNNKQAFQRKIQGFVAGKDSSNGMTGVFDSKQSKVFLAAVLSGVVKGASEAYEIANTQTDVINGALGTQSVTKNFKGKFEELAVAKGVGGASEMVTSWYLEQARALLPTMNVGSGQDLWVVVTDGVDVPDLQANN
jgi:hypothetical protein